VTTSPGVSQADGSAMTTASLSLRDCRSLGLWVLAALIGLLVVVHYHELAFPSASIDFRMTRNEAEEAASVFLVQQGYRAETYRAVTVFDYDDNAKVYLERELGPERANELMHSEVSIWRWRSRFFRPSEQEEFSVSFSPTGHLVGFFREIAEIRDGAFLPQTEARAIAENFLTEYQSLRLSDYNLIEGETVIRENRADHTFTWERRDFLAGEATARTMVTIQGDRLGRYAEFLKVPEAWRRDYAHLRSRNMLMQEVAQSAFIAIILAMLFVMVRELGRRRLTYRFGAQCGIALGLSSLALTLNTLPLTFIQYDTTQSMGSFYGVTFFSAMMGACGWLLYITLAGSVSGAVYRTMLPEKLAPEWLVSRSTVRSKEYLMSCVVGYTMPLIMLGYITAFYLIGNEFGVWSPAAIDYTDLASTSFPWLYPLTVGLMASISEEFIFRMFAIPFLKRYLKSTFLAVLIPAVVWGFLHSSYPQQPFFIRGVELSIVGVLFGYVFIRYGIVSVLIAHYTFDALLMSMFLFQSSRLYFQVAAALVVGIMVIPMIPSLIALVKRRLMVDPKQTNVAVMYQLEEMAAANQEEPPASAAAVPPVTAALLNRRMLIGIVVSVIAVLVLCISLPVTRFLDFLDLRISRHEAIAIADDYLIQKGIDTAPFYRVAEFSRASHLGYIREKEGLERLNEVYRTRLNPAGWQVRYFMPMEKEEYRVFVNPDGYVFRYTHQIDETEPGDSLNRDDALAIAVEAVEASGMDLGDYRVVESSQEQREARADHYYVWEDSVTVIEQGTFRITATVQGDEAVHVRPFFKTPEAWLREQQESTLKDTILRILNITVYGILLVLAMRVYVRQIRQRDINWRLSLAVAAIIPALGILSQVNTLVTFYSSYHTTMSLEAFTTGYFNGLYGYAIMTFLGATLLVSHAESLYRSTFPDLPNLKIWFRDTFRMQTPETRSIWRDALILSYSACALFPGLLHLIAFGEQIFDLETGRRSFPVPYTGSYLPAAAAVIDASSDALLYSGALLAAVLVVRRYLQRTVHLIALLAGIVLLSIAGSVDSWTGFVGEFLKLAVLVVLTCLSFRFFWRDNLLAYILTFFLISLTGDARAMFDGSSGAYYSAAIQTSVLALSPIAVWVYFRFRKVILSEEI